jgi:hypothetical protein
MPEPSRPPWRIEPKLQDQPIRTLIANKEAVVIRCEACPHVARWLPSDLQRRFGKQMTITFARIAPRLRCQSCRSEWVRVSLHRPPAALPLSASDR